MFVIDELKLNGFKRVTLPKGRDLMQRIGKRSVSYAASDEEMPLTMNKIQSLEYISELDKNAQREEAYAAYKADQERREREESHSESTE